MVAALLSVDTGPSWADTTTAVATAIATLVVAVAAWFALRQLREARHGRVTEMIVGWFQLWDSAEFRRRKMEFSRRRPDDHEWIAQRAFRPTQTDEELERHLLDESIPNFFEHLAVLVKEGALPLDLVDRYWGDTVTEVWDQWRRAAMLLRKYEGPDAFKELEWLADELATQSRQRRNPWQALRRR